MNKVICLLFLLFNASAYSQNKKEGKLLDSISSLRLLSKSQDFDLNKRIEFAELAVKFSESLGQDSTLLKSKKNLSFLYLLNQQDVALKNINFENVELAKKLKDSVAIANAYHMLATVYNAFDLKVDSAFYYYYKAAQIYKSIPDNKNAGEVLFNMASIQKNERDYIGSEINAIEAKKLIETLPKTPNNLETLWLINNQLGLVSRELKLYEKSLEYNEVAFKYTKDLEDGYYYQISTISNIASTYREKGDYTTAINKYNEILKNENLISYDSASYASAISNVAHTKLLNGVTSKNEIELPFREAINIAKGIKDVEIELYTYLYIGKYFYTINKEDSAKNYINKSYKLSKSLIENDVLLESLIFKASLSKDSSRHYFLEHIKLNDSLITAERSIRNKFARIDYETDVIIQEKEAISKQNLWLIIISSVLLLSILFLYIIKTQREKNKELQLAQQQQEANEEIYNLMLSQQDKMDEARAVEKKRISQEMHDGILGRLFGTRLSLDSLNMVNTEEAIVSRESYIKDLIDIEKDIRKISHDLNTDFVANTNFSDLIGTLVETQCLAYKLNYNIKIDDDIKWDDITNKTKIHVYRIVQESLQNIYKHAQSKNVSVILDQKDNLISLCIIDDGIGYDKSKQKEGIGLKNIKSRVEAIGGIQKVNTKINNGTTILIEFPINNDTN